MAAPQEFGFHIGGGALILFSCSWTLRANLISPEIEWDQRRGRASRSCRNFSKRAPVLLEAAGLSKAYTVASLFLMM